MRYVIVDLEATCWQKGTKPERMEIIEIGAVMLDSAAGPVSSEFVSFVKPIREPILSDFCTQLTTIKQSDVDTAGDFTNVFPAFLEWIGDEPYTFVSWGGYDKRQFKTECERHGITFPVAFENHMNLKHEFAAVKAIRPCGMKYALELMKIPLVGTHHRGIDDARNIAKIARLILPQIENAD